MICPSCGSKTTVDDGTFKCLDCGYKYRETMRTPYPVRICPMCQGYLVRYKLDVLTSALLGAWGKWHCLSCGYVEHGKDITCDYTVKTFLYTSV